MTLQQHFQVASMKEQGAKIFGSVMCSAVSIDPYHVLKEYLKSVVAITDRSIAERAGFVVAWCSSLSSIDLSLAWS